MKNIKLILFLFLITLTTANVFAQRTYVSIGMGYGFKMAAQNINYLGFYNATYSATTLKEEQINVSLGAGLNVTGTLGYMFNENIGVELGISYLMGAKSTSYYEDNLFQWEVENSLSAKMLRINPSIILTTRNNVVNPYLKFGLVIGSGSFLYESDEIDFSDKLTVKVSFDGGLAMGVSAGMGVLYTLNDQLSLFGEISSVNMSYAPTRGEIIEYTYNGTDVLPSLTTRDKEYEYVDVNTIQLTSSTSPSPSQPQKELKQKYPFSSLGLNFGIRMLF